MNRGWIVIAIVLGVAAAGGGAAYYLTDKYGSPDGMLAEAGLIPAVFSNSGTGAGGFPPPPPPGTSAQPVEGGVDAAAMVADFDHVGQRLVWVLPPGVHASGPFSATVNISHNGDLKHESRIALDAERLESGSRQEFAPGSDVVQLALGDDWPIERDRIVNLIRDLRAAHGPGGGELDVTSDFAVTMDESHRRGYCIEGQELPIHLYVGQLPADAAGSLTLQPVQLGDGVRILQRTILLGGCRAR